MAENGELEELRAQLQQLEELRVRDQQSDTLIRDYHKMVASLHDTMKEMEKKEDEVQAELKELKRQRQLAEAAAGAKEEAQSASRWQLEEQLKSLQAQVAYHQAMATMAGEPARRPEHELAEAKETNGKLSKQVKELEMDLSMAKLESNNQRDELKGVKQRLEVELDASRDELAAMRARCDQLNAEMAALRGAGEPGPGQSAAGSGGAGGVLPDAGSPVAGLVDDEGQHASSPASIVGLPTMQVASPGLTFWAAADATEKLEKARSLEITLRNEVRDVKHRLMAQERDNFELQARVEQLDAPNDNQRAQVASRGLGVVSGQQQQQQAMQAAPAAQHVAMPAVEERRDEGLVAPVGTDRQLLGLGDEQFDGGLAQDAAHPTLNGDDSMGSLQWLMAEEDSMQAARAEVHAGELRAQLAAAERNLEWLRDQLETRAGGLEAANSRLQQAGAAASMERDLRTELDALRAAAEQSAAALVAAESARDQMRQQVQRLQEESHEARKQADTLRQAGEQATVSQRSFGLERDRLLQQVLRLQAEQHGACRQAEAAVGAARELRHQVNNMFNNAKVDAAALAVMTDERDRLNKQVYTLQAEAAAAYAARDAATAVQNQLSEQVLHLHTALQEALEQADTLRQEAEQATVGLGHARAEGGQLSEEVQQLQAELQEARLARQQLLEDSTAWRKKMDDAKEEIDKLLARNALLQEKAELQRINDHAESGGGAPGPSAPQRRGRGAARVPSAEEEEDMAPMPGEEEAPPEVHEAPAAAAPQRRGRRAQGAPAQAHDQADAAPEVPEAVPAAVQRKPDRAQAAKRVAAPVQAAPGGPRAAGELAGAGSAGGDRGGPSGSGRAAGPGPAPGGPGALEQAEGDPLDPLAGTVVTGHADLAARICELVKLEPGDPYIERALTVVEEADSVPTAVMPNNRNLHLWLCKASGCTEMLVCNFRPHASTYIDGAQLAAFAPLGDISGAGGASVALAAPRDKDWVLIKLSDDALLLIRSPNVSGPKHGGRCSAFWLLRQRGGAQQIAIIGDIFPKRSKPQPDTKQAPDLRRMAALREAVEHLRQLGAKRWCWADDTSANGCWLPLPSI